MAATAQDPVNEAEQTSSAPTTAAGDSPSQDAEVDIGAMDSQISPVEFEAMVEPDGERGRGMGAARSG